MSGKTITMSELNRLATEEIKRRYKKLGISRPVRAAGFATALCGKAHRNANTWLADQMKG